MDDLALRTLFPPRLLLRAFDERGSAPRPATIYQHAPQLCPSASIPLHQAPHWKIRCFNLFDWLHSSLLRSLFGGLALIGFIRECAAVLSLTRHCCFFHLSAFSSAAFQPRLCSIPFSQASSRISNLPRSFTWRRTPFSLLACILSSISCLYSHRQHQDKTTALRLTVFLRPEGTRRAPLSLLQEQYRCKRHRQTKTVFKPGNGLLMGEGPRMVTVRFIDRLRIGQKVCSSFRVIFSQHFYLVKSLWFLL